MMAVWKAGKWYYLGGLLGVNRNKGLVGSRLVSKLFQLFVQ